MVSGGLLLKEKYEFSFFSTELASLLHHISDIKNYKRIMWYRRILSKEGLLFLCFLDIKDRSSSWGCANSAGLHDYDVWCTQICHDEEGARWPQIQGSNSPILQSHIAGQGRNRHLRRVKGQIYTAWSSTDCLLSSSSYQGACPNLHCWGGDTIWMKVSCHAKGEPPGFCAAGRACKWLPAVPQAREDKQSLTQ